MSANNERESQGAPSLCWVLSTRLYCNVQSAKLVKHGAVITSLTECFALSDFLVCHTRSARGALLACLGTLTVLY